MDKQISLSNNARKEAGKHFGNMANRKRSILEYFACDDKV